MGAESTISTEQLIARADRALDTARILRRELRIELALAAARLDLMKQRTLAFERSLSRAFGARGSFEPDA